MGQYQTLQEHVHIPLSRMVATAIGAQPHHCAVNAWRTLMECPAYFREGGSLVEGWCVIEEATQIALVEHVWCRQANGWLVDPSIVLLLDESTPVCYFAGLARTYAETKALEGEMFPHVRFDGVHGDDGLGHPGYQAAWKAGRKKAYTLAFACKPPKVLQFQRARRLDESRHTSPERGVMFPVIEGNSLDLSLSLKTASVIRAAPEHCWYNARLALLEMPHPFCTATYIEGWVVGVWSQAIRVSEHGWIARRDGTIVDPSLVLGPLPQRLIYLPGLHLSWLELQAYRTTHLPLAREQWPRSPEYQDACQHALKRAEELAWETGLPIFIEPGSTRTLQFMDGTLHMSEFVWDLPVSSLPPW